MRQFGRWLLALAIGGCIVLFFALDLGRYLTLDYLLAQRVSLEQWVRVHPVASATAYFVFYVAVTALSLPGATVMTLAGGALFGVLFGTVLVSFASTVGATAAFLVARGLFRDRIKQRLPDRWQAVERGVNQDGAFYLFALRLVPVFPFFVINLLMGLTPLRTVTFYWVSQVGMLPATVVYVNAGTQLGAVGSFGDVLSPSLWISFALLGVFPFFARWLVNRLRRRRLYHRWPRPRAFDRNLVVIGAGSAGLVSAYIAATLKAQVSLIERHRMGGDCLNTGCVPSKALIRTARFVHQARHAEALGIRSAKVDFDFRDVMTRVERVVRQIEPHDSPERYIGLGVDVIQGAARVTSPYTVEVNGQVIRTRNIILATGARPVVPPIPGLADVPYLTSDNLWALRELPERLLVLGGGPIGCELAQAFARLGSRVVQVEMGDQLLPQEDGDIAERVERTFRQEGIDVRLGYRAVAVQASGRGHVLVCEHGNESVALPFDRILVAVGRGPNTEGLGLEQLGITTAGQGAIDVNEYLQTRYPNILACGDVVGPYQFTHVSAHQAWFATVNALFRGLRRFRVDYSVIPRCTYVDPEVARVGLNEREARAQGIPYEMTTYELADLDRAIADDAAEGVVKVLTVPGKDRVLGATIVGRHSAEMLTEFVTAMRHGLGLNKLLATIHVYPSFSEANKYAAGAWKRDHAPERVLTWLSRWHRWRLGRPMGRSATSVVPPAAPED